jgi:hypothetical protein
MLAFAQQKKAINWNQTMFLQPKLDGVRCIFTKQGAFSRSGKKFKNVQHLRRELKPFFASNPTVVLDGELYNHAFKDNFNKIISLVRTQHATKDQTLIQFHCYDYVQTANNHSFDWRNKCISLMIHNYRLRYTHSVATTLTPNKGLATIFNNQNLKAGYEGSILRTNLPYEHNQTTYSNSKHSKIQKQQSQDLLKAKASEAAQLASSWLLIATVSLLACLLWKVMTSCVLCLPTLMIMSAK